MKQKQEYFAVSKDTGASVVPSTLDAGNRTVDVVWYGGATVPRMDADTGEEYMLRLDMAGCRMDRLNAGAPVFDNHMTGQGLSSIITKRVGTKAQIGTVLKAWADGPMGMATLKFRDEGDDEDADQIFSGIASGIINNLSFGTWIYNKKPDGESAAGASSNVFVADDWEPFEISPVCVPADFTTQFLTASGSIKPAEKFHRATGDPLENLMADASQAIKLFSTVMNQKIADGAAQTVEPATPAESRATAQKKETPVMDKANLDAGEKARQEQVMLEAARAEGANQERLRQSEIHTMGQTHKMASLAESLIAKGATVESARKEFTRAASITAMATPHLKYGLTQTFIDSLVADGTSLEAAQGKVLAELAAVGERGSNGQPVRTIGEFAQVTGDAAETRFACMEAALMLRVNPKAFAKLDATERRKMEGMGREYRSFRLIEMARESLEIRGISHRGKSLTELALAALVVNPGRVEVFGGGQESTSDFPGILNNVANKTLRMAYEAWPQTFPVFCRMVSAPDFKPINRAQLNDLGSLQPLGEGGEFKTANLTDSNINYKLAPFGGIVRITRAAIINDDLSAFTRTSTALGVAASQTQSDTVYGILTNNTQKMQDGNVLFHAAHKNLNTGASSALTYGTAADSTAALTAARAAMRQQVGPQGTHLNLVPRFVLVGTTNESQLDKLISPINIASSDVTKVVPTWVRSLVPIVEARLDAANSPWYLSADPAQIDTIEYCFLEGQEGVYFETRQGFDVDGIEMKARMDFAAAAIEQRGLQKNAGA